MIEINIEQGSQEWLKLRLGKITGTRVKNIFKSDNLTLIDEIIAEIVSEEIEENYVNSAMQRGKDLEPIVRQIYQKVKGIEIQEIGFCMSDESDFLGLSPDGYTIDRVGGIEIKCPSTKTHVKYIRQNKIPSEYICQVYTNFIVNKKLEWLDFISYDDRFKSRPMWIKRVHRTEILAELSMTEIGIKDFEKKILKFYKQITSDEI